MNSSRVDVTASICITGSMDTSNNLPPGRSALQKLHIAASTFGSSNKLNMFTTMEARLTKSSGRSTSKSCRTKRTRRPPCSRDVSASMKRGLKSNPVYSAFRHSESSRRSSHPSPQPVSRIVGEPSASTSCNRRLMHIAIGCQISRKWRICPCSQNSELPFQF